MTISSIQNSYFNAFVNLPKPKTDTANNNVDTAPITNKSTKLNSSVEISDNAKRLYEQSEKNITSNPDWTTDTTITSIDLNKLNLGQQKSLQNSQVQPNIQISSATFSDPDMRPQLQAYYESKKTDLNEFIKGQKVEVIPFSKWLEFSAQSFQENDSGPLSIQAAQQNIEKVFRTFFKNWHKIPNKFSPYTFPIYLSNSAPDRNSNDFGDFFLEDLDVL